MLAILTLTLAFAADPADDPELKKQLAAIGKQLASRNQKNIIAGLEEAKKLGPKAEPLLRRVCEHLLGKNDDIAAAASEALAEIHTKLQDPLLKLRGQADDPDRVFSGVEFLGKDGLPLAWMVYGHLNALLAKQTPNMNSNGPALAAKGFKTLMTIGDESEEHWKLVLRFKMAGFGGYDKSYQNFIANDRAKRLWHLKQLIATQKTFTIDELDQIASIGKEAKEALPKLKAMTKLSPIKEVREAAQAAIEAIEEDLKRK
jgi:hypothetical protein